MACAPTFSPAARVSEPLKLSPLTRVPLVIWYVSAGSASPYAFDFASAVTVIGLLFTVREPVVLLLAKFPLAVKLTLKFREPAANPVMPVKLAVNTVPAELVEVGLIGLPPSIVRATKPVGARVPVAAVIVAVTLAAVP